MVGLTDVQKISIHALREEGDDGSSNVYGWVDISIHALREEGDIPCAGQRKQL